MMAQEQELTADAAPEPPGQTLAAERKKQGLSEREVADQLKITLSKLHALEQDQYDKFPAQIYLKGYLKNYARLLRLSEQDISDSYKAFVGGSAVEEDYAPAPEPAGEAKSKKMWPVWLLVAAIVVVSFFVYSQLNQPVVNSNADAAAAIFEPPITDNAASNAESLADENENIDPVVKDALADADNIVQEPVQNSQSEAVEQPERDVIVDGRDVIADERDVIVGEQDVIVDEPVEILASKVTAAELISLTEPEIEEEPVVVEVVNLADILDFQFINQCWIEVRDSTGSLLYSGLENAGSQRQIEGEGPFQVVIGNVVGTALSFNGETIPLEAPANGRALRLQVGS